MDLPKHLQYIINHVFLPPRLPQESDDDEHESLRLIRYVEKSLQVYLSVCDQDSRSAVSRCFSMIQGTIEFHKSKKQEQLGDYLRQMSVGGKCEYSCCRLLTDVCGLPIDSLALHIKAQNAGVLIERLQSTFLFMSFELSATSEAVMACRGRLQRFFPGPCIAIHDDRVFDNTFSSKLAETLEKLDKETPDEAVPKTLKADSEVIESRDTIHPMFVTGMVMSTLRAIGETPKVRRFQKNVREDVLWSNAQLPWRRSPVWLLLRVSMQMSLDHEKDTSRLGSEYKPFMVFLMSRILHDALQNNPSSETLFVMSAKITRRIQKLDPNREAPWLSATRVAVTRARETIDQRWQSLQRDSSYLIEHQPLFQAGLFSDAMKLTLPHLRPYLSQRELANQLGQAAYEIRLGDASRIKWCSSGLPSGSPDSLSTNNIALWLIDIESWIENSLQSWASTLHDIHGRHVHLSNMISTDLGQLICGYKEKASHAYDGRPEEYSIMVLTLMEMWQVLDKFVVSGCSLLGDYDPGFPPQIFETLLLKSRSQMDRLHQIELYLKQRRRLALFPRSYIFTSIKEENSFAVRFFNGSIHHQGLRERIERDAQDARLQKQETLSRQSQTHRDLLQRADRLDCEYVERHKKRRKWTEHSSRCRKCALTKEAQSMKIGIYEWPLPMTSLEARSVVFELDVPCDFSKWRDVTLGLLVDTLSSVDAVHPAATPSNKLFSFGKVDSLRKFVKTKNPRFQLLSTSKPFCVTHSKSVAISNATEENVCLNHGPTYEAYDRTHMKSTSLVLRNLDLRGRCTFRLPKGPYQKLQYAVEDTNHTSNQAIANRSHCPPSIDFHEYYCFGTLRAGHQLQLYNIARELATGKLDFNKEEVYMLFVQALWQAGPRLRDDACRDTHAILEDAEFGRDLLRALEIALQAHNGNWQNCAAMSVFSAVCRRLLSLATNETIQNECLAYLYQLRTTEFDWMHTLMQQRYHTHEEQSRQELALEALNVALVFHETFDVDPSYSGELLVPPSNVTFVTKCAILIHDLCPADRACLPIATQRLLQRFHRLSVSLEQPLRTLITLNGQGLDDAVRSLWGGYRAASPWVACERRENWLTTTTVEDESVSAARLHFNLLDGTLLVNGSPLARLPHEYERHETYIRLLGKVSAGNFRSRQEMLTYL